MRGGGSPIKTEEQGVRGGRSPVCPGERGAAGVGIRAGGEGRKIPYLHRGAEVAGGEGWGIPPFSPRSGEVDGRFTANGRYLIPMLPRVN